MHSRVEATPATFLALQRTAELAELLDEGAELEETHHGARLLYAAAAQGADAAVELLLERGASVNERRSHSDERFHLTSPLYIAAREGHDVCVRILIEARADLFATSFLGMTPSYIAAQRGNVECLRLLINASALVRSDNEKSGRSLAWAASQNGCADCLQLLAEHDANLSRKDIDGTTPAFKAAENNHVDCLLLLVDHAADIHSASADTYSDLGNKSPLAVARIKGYHAVEILLALALAEEHDMPRLRKASVFAAGDTRLLVSGLVHAFCRSPARASSAALRLARRFTRESEKNVQLDKEGAVRLVESKQNLELILGFLLGVMNEAELLKLLSNEGRLLDEALVAECNQLMSATAVQRALYDLWGVVLPNEVVDFDKEKVVLAFADIRTLFWSSLEFAGAILVNLALLIPMAAFPPLRIALEHHMAKLTEDARARVIRENPQTTEPNGDQVVVLCLRGLGISYYFDFDPLEKKQQAIDSFLQARQRLVQQSVRVAVRNFPLMFPEGKFWTDAISSLLVATLIASKSLTDLDVLYFIWIAQIIVKPVVEMAIPRFSTWLMDPINPLHTCSLLLLLAGLSCKAFDFALEAKIKCSATNRLTAGGLTMLWILTTFRAMQRFSSLGPLAVMLKLMCGDVLRFLILVSGITFGFAAGLTYLVQSGSSFGKFKWTSKDVFESDCGLFNERTWGDNVAASVLVLVEIGLGAYDREEGPLDCLGKSDYGITAEIMLLAFYVLIVLLGLNMLIAMMATTFDKVRDQLDSFHNMQTAHAYAMWGGACPSPPPVWILSWPYHTLRVLADSLKMCGHRKDSHAAPQSWTHRKDSSIRGQAMINQGSILQQVQMHLQAHGGNAAAGNVRWKNTFLRNQIKLLSLVEKNVEQTSWSRKEFTTLNEKLHRLDDEFDAMQKKLDHLLECTMSSSTSSC